MATTQHQHPIGEVSFRKEGRSWTEEPIGTERVRLLRAFYRHEDTGDERPYSYGCGCRWLTWDQVAWRTAGAAVTED